MAISEKYRLLVSTSSVAVFTCRKEARNKRTQFPPDRKYLSTSDPPQPPTPPPQKKEKKNSVKISTRRKND